MDFLAYFATVSVLAIWFLIMLLNWRIKVLKYRVEQLEANHFHVAKDLYVNIFLLKNEIEKLRSELKNK